MSYKQIPQLAIVLILYNILAFTMGADGIDRPQFTIMLFSGAAWPVSIGNILVALGLVLLYVEIIKSTRTGRTAALDHSLSMLVFVVSLLEFILVRQRGTSTFLAIALFSAFDILAGFQVSIAAARRDIEIDRVTGTN